MLLSCWRNEHQSSERSSLSWCFDVGGEDLCHLPCLGFTDFYLVGQIVTWWLELKEMPGVLDSLSLLLAQACCSSYPELSARCAKVSHRLDALKWSYACNSNVLHIFWIQHCSNRFKCHSSCLGYHRYHLAATRDKIAMALQLYRTACNTISK